MPQLPFISIPLDIPDVRIVQTAITKVGEFILTVESTLTSTTCRHGGRIITELHGIDQPRLLRHRSILDRPVYLRIRPQRFRCPWCADHPTTTQQLDWYDPNALHTNAYEQHLIMQLINSTLTDVTEKEDVSSAALLGILDRWIATTVDWDALPAFAILGIAAIALTKGRRAYVAIITARTASGDLHVVAVLADRLKATIKAWLGALPRAIRAGITTVCTDMWDGYVRAVAAVLPTATIVVDRFHVACHYREALDTLRKPEVRRLRKELPVEQHDAVTHIMWRLRKQPADLTADEQQQLATLFPLRPALQQASTLREQLTRIFDTARSKADGLRRIRFWRQRMERSGRSCFDPFLKLRDTWLDRSANYCINRATSGFVEGLNNKRKVLKRRCYGLRNVGRLFQRLTLDVDGYRRFSPWRATTTSRAAHGNS